MDSKNSARQDWTSGRHAASPSGQRLLQLTTACLPSQCHCGLTGLASCQGPHCRKFIEHLIYSGIKQNHRAQGRSLSFPSWGPFQITSLLGGNIACPIALSVAFFGLHTRSLSSGTSRTWGALKAKLLLALTLREVAGLFR